MKACFHKGSFENSLSFAKQMTANETKFRERPLWEILLIYDT